MAAAIPEEVETNNNDNDNTVVLPPAPPVQQAEHPTTQQMQYLQVRIPTFQSTVQPSRIHRRRHHRQPPQPTNSNNKHGPPNSQLHTRTKTKGSKHSSSSSNHTIEELGEIVKVLIPTNGFQSEKQLADCLSQASAANSSSAGSGGYTDRWNDDRWIEYHDDDDDYSLDEYYDTDRSTSSRSNVTVAGMFRESDRVFVPLSVIYAQPTLFVGEVLCIKRPPPPPKPKRQLLRGPTSGDDSPTTKRRSMFITFLEIMGIILVSIASYKLYDTASCIDWQTLLQTSLYKVERGFFTILNFPFYLFDIVIEFPLRELYRHGPSIIGWEGEPLPKICARITYHGDEIFWSRNIEECTRIYQAKELAAMQVRKPIVIGFIICVLFYMIKSIVEARALRRRERIDPNMVETYRAIQMLTRQLRRAANGR